LFFLVDLSWHLILIRCQLFFCHYIYPMDQKEELYFKDDIQWRKWLSENHISSEGIYLIFYKAENNEASMHWEEVI
jgi:hypothetical protein